MAYIDNVCHMSGFSSANDYMNKAQWNSIILDGSIPQGENEWIMDNSYMSVVSKMTKKESISRINGLLAKT